MDFWEWICQAPATRRSEGWRLSLRGPAAIHQKVCACNEPGIFRAEIYGKLTYFFRFAPAANRDLRDEFLVEFGIFEQRRIQFGCERAGADAVDCDLVG